MWCRQPGPVEEQLAQLCHGTQISLTPAPSSLSCTPVSWVLMMTHLCAAADWSRRGKHCCRHHHLLPSGRPCEGCVVDAASCCALHGCCGGTCR